MRRKIKMLRQGLKRLRARPVYALSVLAALFFTLYAISGDAPGHWSSTAQLLLDDGQQPAGNATRVILFWTTFFDRRDFYLGFGRSPFSGCPVSDCLTTDDRARLLDASAVVFHARDLSGYDLPRARRTSQRYVFFLYESPPHTWMDLRSLAGFFNWTMTYRFDSDVPPRVRLVELPGNGTTEASEDRSKNENKKKKLVAWIVSNCHAHNRRETYVAELRRHVPVDVFGACGDRGSETCPHGASLEQCYAGVERDYKFYLAFENSNCRDYVTEKWSTALRHDVVPVVYGGADYGAFAPPRSYVDVRDFASPRRLAEHLLRLDANDAAYGEYLVWKRRYRVELDTMPWCDMCAKLHDTGAPRKSYADIHGWWVDGGNCSDATQLPEMGRSALSQYAGLAADAVAFRMNSLVLRAKHAWRALMS